MPSLSPKFIRCTEQCQLSNITRSLNLQLPLSTHTANNLLTQSLRLSPPVIGIRIKHEIATVGKCHIKDVTKEEENYKSDPLQPSGASCALMIRREGDEREEEHEGESHPVTECGGGHVYILFSVCLDGV